MTTARTIAEKDYAEFACSIYSIIKSVNPEMLPGILEKIKYNIQDHHYPDASKKSRVHVYFEFTTDKFIIKYDVSTTGGANYDQVFEFSKQKAVIEQKYWDTRYGGSSNSCITVENGKLSSVKEFDKRKDQLEFSEVSLTENQKIWKLGYFFSCYKMHTIPEFANQFQVGATISPQQTSVTSPSIETNVLPLPTQTMEDLQQLIVNLQQQLDLRQQIENLQLQLVNLQLQAGKGQGEEVDVAKLQALRDAESLKVLLATAERQAQKRSREMAYLNNQTSISQGYK